MKNQRVTKAKKIAVVSILAAFIIVLQSLGGIFQIGGLSLSFVLVPIVLGAIVYGTACGTLLGLIFSVVVFLFGVLGLEPFTQYLFMNFPLLTFLTIFVKGTLAGLLAGLIFKLLKNLNEYVAVVTAALCAPMINTGFFMIGVLLMGDTVIVMLSISVLFNFLIETAINIILAPSLYRVVKIVKR